MPQSNSGSGQTRTANIQSIPDTSLLPYMGVPGTEGEVAAMDDLQFMEVLLDNDSSLGDTEQEHVNSGTIEGNSNSGTTSTSNLSCSKSETLSSTVLDSSERDPCIDQQQASKLQQNQLEGSETRPSSLTARLNYPNFGSTGMVHVPFPDPAQPTAPTVGLHTEVKRNVLSTSSDSLTARKRARDQAPPVSEDEGEKQRRRTDRNLREQQRSHKITEQISYLRDLLADENVHFKPDKYSTLISVVEYIRQLQSRSSFLVEEHKKLLETIFRTNEVVKCSYYHATADGPVLTTSSDLLVDVPAASFALEEDHSVFVRGVDYRNIFKQCGIALAVASIDGRFMDCNTEFEVLTGYEREELLSSEREEAIEIKADSVLSQDGVPSTVATLRRRNLSLFNLLGREDMEQVFRAMSVMLKQPVDLREGGVVNQTNRATDGTGSRNSTHFDCWSGYVTKSRLMEDKVNILTLVAASVKTF
jgi:PAS domain-containing protein